MVASGVKEPRSFMSDAIHPVSATEMMRLSATRGLARRSWHAALAAAFLGLLFGVAPASADKIKHSIAVFSGLDKITGRITTFEVGTNETVQFGSLQITERVCYSRPPTEAPRTDTFIEVDNIDPTNHYKRIFTGWMFAGSPSLHALDHPVYDIWLLRCSGTTELIPETTSSEAPAPATPPQQDTARPQEPSKPAHPKSEEAKRPPAQANGPIEVGPPPGFNPPSQRPGPPHHFDAAPPQSNDDGF